MSGPTQHITILTGNQGKVAEFERLLVTGLANIKIDTIEIQDTDVAVVAKKKAEDGFAKLGEACFVDDTGLTIHAWGNLPGALIKWFVDNVGNDGIIAMLEKAESRAATVTTALGYCDEHGSQVFIGELHGTIAHFPRGENGFGYDPIFIPEGHDKTFAEMTGEEKDTVSMRAIAAQKMKAALFN